MGCACLKTNAEEFLKIVDDPTKTVGIRRRWITQYSKRYRQLKGRINKLLLMGEPGLIPVPLVNPQTLEVINQFEFTKDATAVAEFMAWLQLQVNDLLFTNDATVSTIWQNKFIDQSYVRGINRSKADLRKLGLTAERLARLTPANIVGTATPVIGIGGAELAGTAVRPIHLEAIQLLYTREFQALKGITDEMSKQISRVLVEGIEQGLGIKDIARGINNRVDKIGLTRSKLLARTETARAYNIGNINEFKAISEQIGIEPMYLWTTAGDELVRDTHNDRDGQIFTEAEARALIGEPNCRCAISPHIDPELLKAA